MLLLVTLFYGKVKYVVYITLHVKILMGCTLKTEGHGENFMEILKQYLNLFGYFHLINYVLNTCKKYLQIFDDNNTR